jgi:hypothetical protein
MKSKFHLVAILSAIFSLAAIAGAQSSHSDCPLHQEHQSGKPKTGDQSSHQHDGHLAGVNKRGDQAMGFDHQKTTHHFRLLKDGGAIEVTANDPKDTASRDQIQQHLSQIAEMFSHGDFKSPIFIHSQTPPGVPLMAQLKSEIKYKFEKTERGASVRISTNNAEALTAIHEFLRFQIKDHQTGDSLEVEKKDKGKH